MKSLAQLFGIGSGEAKKEEKEPTEEKILTEIEEAQCEEAAADDKNHVKYIDIHMVVPNPFQPRKTFNDEALQELSSSIQEYGIIQPLLVRSVEDHYELVAGERRLRASKLAKLTEVPVIVKEINDKEMAELAMIENLQREDLHFLEEAEGFHQLLINFGFTQDELAKRMGKSQSTVANKLRLLKLSDNVRQTLFSASLTERHARALLKLSDEEQQLEVLRLIVEKGLNVKESEMLIQDILEEMPANKKKSRQNVMGVVRDVRIFLNTIQRVVGEMNKSGLKVDVKQEQDEEYITVKMKIPKKKR